MTSFNGKDYYESNYKLAECLYYDRENKPVVSDLVSLSGDQTEYDFILTSMKTKEFFLRFDRAFF